MSATRLWRIGLALVLALAAPAPAWAQAADDEVAVYKREVDKAFAAWLQALWPDAEAAGISRKTFDANIKGLKLDWSLPHLVLPDPAVPGGPPLPKALAPKPIHQPEFDIPANYFNKTTLSVARHHRTRQVRASGRSSLRRQQNHMACRRASSSPSGDGRSGFGKADDCRSMHCRPSPRKATWGGGLTCSARRSIAALKIIEEGNATRAEMRSSWAGAMGYTQFLPSDFEKYAVDFDGDGRRDIWNSVPDALGSTGNSLHSQGWDGKQTWGYEVTLPKGFDCTEQGPDKARSIAEWVKLGVARVKDRPFPEDKLQDPAFLVLPAGLKGPAFLATNNFSVLKLYNNSDVYALFVGHVADMIAANAPVEFAGEWQPVERLPRERIQRFQEALVAKGHDVGNVDGLAGFKTRRTIGIEEQKLGLPLSCYPNKTVVDAVLKQVGAAAAQ